MMTINKPKLSADAKSTVRKKEPNKKQVQPNGLIRLPFAAIVWDVTQRFSPNVA